MSCNIDNIDNIVVESEKCYFDCSNIDVHICKNDFVYNSCHNECLRRQAIIANVIYNIVKN